MPPIDWDAVLTAHEAEIVGDDDAPLQARRLASGGTIAAPTLATPRHHLRDMVALVIAMALIGAALGAHLAGWW